MRPLIIYQPQGISVERLGSYRACRIRAWVSPAVNSRVGRENVGMEGGGGLPAGAERVGSGLFLRILCTTLV